MDWPPTLPGTGLGASMGRRWTCSGCSDGKVEIFELGTQVCQAHAFNSHHEGGGVVIPVVQLRKL